MNRAFTMLACHGTAKSIDFVPEPIAISTRVTALGQDMMNAAPVGPAAGDTSARSRLP